MSNGPISVVFQALNFLGGTLFLPMAFHSVQSQFWNVPTNSDWNRMELTT